MYLFGAYGSEALKGVFERHGATVVNRFLLSDPIGALTIPVNEYYPQMKTPPSNLRELTNHVLSWGKVEAFKAKVVLDIALDEVSGRLIFNGHNTPSETPSLTVSRSREWRDGGALYRQEVQKTLFRKRSKKGIMKRHPPFGAGED